MIRPEDLRRTGRVVKTNIGPERLFLGPRDGKYIVIGRTAKMLGKRTKLGYTVLR